MKIAAGPFKPSMKDSLSMLESSVDSDSSRGLYGQGKFRELSSHPTTVLFSRGFSISTTSRQPADSQKIEGFRPSISVMTEEGFRSLLHDHNFYLLVPHSLQTAVTFII